MNAKSNVNKVINDLLGKIQSFEKGGELSDSILREIATTMRAEVGTRIHEEGKNAAGGDIGQYTSGSYKALRNRKGRRIDKVDLSFTRQMSNQFSVIATANGYGLGWADTEKTDRAGYLEKRYGKIWALTEDEKKQTEAIAESSVKKLFNT